MTPQERHHQQRARKHRQRKAALESIDAQWKAYHRYVFRICADHLSPSEDLVWFALTVAEPVELKSIVVHVLKDKEFLKLPENAVSELESADSPPAPEAHNSTSPGRLREVCFSVARHNETLYPIVVDLISKYVEHAEGTGRDGNYPALPAIVNRIGGVFTLSPLQKRILMALYALEDMEAMSNLMSQATHRSQIALMADAADADLAGFVRETAAGSTLERRGLIAFRGGRDEVFDINVSRPVLFALRSNTLDDLRAGLFDDTPSPQFHISEFPLSQDEVRTCAAAVRGGYPLLLAGEPGIGKTEFARALVASLDRKAYTLAAQNRHSPHFSSSRSETTESTRFNAIRMGGNLLSSSSEVLIIDEADAILQSAAGFFSLFGGGPGGGSYDKGKLNDLLEHLPVATIWITNDHRMIPSSALRRFAHVLAFPHPTIETRMRMLSERLEPLTTGSQQDESSGAHPGISGWTRDLAARYDVTPAAVDRAARIVAAELDAQDLSPDDVPDRVCGYIDQISTGALAHDVRRLPTVDPSFDPQFCSASESLERVERLALRRTQAASGLRLLFAGPPGGGKTQYALWLAKRLGRDVVLKRPSDLLSKYVGESEQMIAAAFRTAARAGSVLVIDEADALLYDRAMAQRSWEHSQIAEFLQQVQEYSGLLIACTNRVDAVDPALRRRFHKHVTFRALSDRVLPAALAHIFPDVTFAAADITALTQGPPLMMSDLATAKEVLDMDGLDEGDDTPAAPDGPVFTRGAPSAASVVEEILANARSRDRTREIGF